MSLFKLGQITSPVGIKGEVRVYPYFSDITRFSDIKTVLLDEKECQVLSYRIDKNMLVVKLDGITDRNAAETLRNKFLYVPKENFKNPEGTYYVEDLIGIKVYDENDNFIGVVDDIDETSPQDKFVIKTDSKTFMLPSVKEFILSLDVENKKMTVHLIDGILDL